MTRTAGAQIGCQRPSRFWGLGCPKIYHEAEDTLAAALRNGTRAARGGGFLEELHRILSGKRQRFRTCCGV
ncbi:hypothetical protein [Thiolapillus sp.]|uniref:hypothetical protein n=2 Tax=Thiolapillus sp. TaxID=2017437 RepID=UPI0025DBEF38|nr:hypothetical protein [Thiolapillus sp.]